MNYIFLILLWKRKIIQVLKAILTLNQHKLTWESHASAEACNQPRSTICQYTWNYSREIDMKCTCIRTLVAVTEVNLLNLWKWSLESFKVFACLKLRRKCLKPWIIALGTSGLLYFSFGPIVWLSNSLYFQRNLTSRLKTAKPITDKNANHVILWIKSQWSRQSDEMISRF